MSGINATKCSPVQMRKALELVEVLKSAGMDFIPVPVLNDEDRARLIAITADRIERIAAYVESGAA
jgi:hypothetical protein